MRIRTLHILYLLIEEKEQEQEADPVERDVQEGEVIEIQEEMETPPGDWWQRMFSYDEAVEKIDTLPRQHRVGLKSVISSDSSLLW